MARSRSDSLAEDPLPIEEGAYFSYSAPLPSRTRSPDGPAGAAPVGAAGGAAIARNAELRLAIRARSQRQQQQQAAEGGEEPRAHAASAAPPAALQELPSQPPPAEQQQQRAEEQACVQGAGRMVVKLRIKSPALAECDCTSVQLPGAPQRPPQQQGSQGLGALPLQPATAAGAPQLPAPHTEDSQAAPTEAAAIAAAALSMPAEQPQTQTQPAPVVPAVPQFGFGSTGVPAPELRHTAHPSAAAALLVAPASAAPAPVAAPAAATAGPLLPASPSANLGNLLAALSETTPLKGAPPPAVPQLPWLSPAVGMEGWDF